MAPVKTHQGPLLLIALVPEAGRSAGYLAVSTAIGYVLGLVLTPALGHWSDRRDTKATRLMVVLLALAAVLALIAVARDPLVISGLAVLVGIGGRWLNTLQRAIQMALATAEQRTTFFMANQLPFFGGLPVRLLLAMTAVQLIGSVPTALLVVSGLFALGAASWGGQWRGQRVRAATPRS